MSLIIICDGCEVYLNPYEEIFEVSKKAQWLLYEKAFFKP